MKQTGICWLLVAFALIAGAGSRAHAFTPDDLWNLWPEERFVTTSAPCIRPAELYGSLESLAAKYPNDLKLEEIGRSFQDRPIHMMTLGRGETKVLLWSQMHGDEPSATPALLDIVDYLLGNPDEPDAKAILDGTTLLMIPMLNPDGSEVYQRRNAQGIDINRDALNLATPEGLFGFNLHDQNRRTAVGDTGKLATNAVLAVSGDPEGTLTPGRARTKRACAAIIKALAPFMPGGMARYDEDWSPRSFGDNVTGWGTAVILIESGGVPAGHDLSQLTRLNFLAILEVLKEFVRNDLADHDPEVYEVLPRNESNAWSEVAVRGGYLMQPGTTLPYRADLSINLAEDDHRAARCVPDASGDSHGPSQIMEIGDSRFIAAGVNVDATGKLIVAPFEVAVRGWKARRWLGEKTLDQLASMGVGSVRWQVKRRHARRARARSRELAATSAVRIEVAEPPVESQWVKLPGPPPPAESELLLAQLATLGGDGPMQDLEDRPVEEILQRFWPRSRGARSTMPPALRRRQPASFLLIGPAAEGALDPRTARLVGVWLDGREIEIEP